MIAARFAKRLAWCAALVATIGCGAPKVGVLKLNGAPPDALVTVDDHYAGKLGRLGKFGVKLRAGEHRVTIEADGFFPHDAIVQVPANGDVKLDVKLEAVPD
jgi:hypothetical protein